jgi:hypothetical protein
MPVIEMTIEERLHELTRECSKQSLGLTLEYDPSTELWCGYFDDSPEVTGSFDEVVEALEAELNL